MVWQGFVVMSEYGRWLLHLKPETKAKHGACFKAGQINKKNENPRLLLTLSLFQRGSSPVHLPQIRGRPRMSF
jgi:hypothetical protein